MPSLAPFIVTALVAGALHSFGPDHLAAVSVFVSRKPHWRRSAGLGARWGLGHSASILLVGGLVVLSGLTVPARFESAAERLIGVVLIALGITALWRAWKMHAHVHSHGGSTHWHVHSHAADPSHDHSHGALFGIGMLHGLAGTGAVVVVMVPLIGGSRVGGFIYLLAFGLGTICSMALFGGTAGHALKAAGGGRPAFHRIALGLAGAASVAVGLWWVTTGGY
jgi:sulfite exporter TauE/SafE